MANVHGQVNYGKVICNVREFLADTPADADSIPDARPLTGTVSASPSITVMKWPTATPPQTSIITPITIPVINGLLYPPGTTQADVDGPTPPDPGIWLVAEDQPDAAPNKVHWTFTFRLSGVSVQPPSLTGVAVPTGGEVDLTLIMPTDPDPGVSYVVVAESGVVQSIADATAAADAANAALSSKANAADLGTAAATDATDYATAAQGSKADTAVQPAALSAYQTTAGLDAATAAAMNTPGSALRASADARYVAMAPAPNGTDDTEALQAVLDAVPAEGGVVRLRAGVYKVPNGGLACSRPLRIEGAGAGTYESGGSRIEVTSPTATLLSLSSPGVQLRDLAIVNKSGTRPTDGAGVLLTDADFIRVNNVLIDGFWNNLQIDSGYYYSITDSTFLNPRNIGIWLRNTAAGQFDHSDQIIHGCTITKYGDTVAGGTAVKWQSGGGLRFTSNKINGGTQPGYTSTAKFSHGLHISVSDGGSTSVFPIVGNSIENCTVAHILADTAGPAHSGVISKLIVSGNEIGIGGIGVGIHPTAVGGVRQATIEGNYIGNVSSAISCMNAWDVVVGTNMLSAFSTGVYINAGCGNIDVHEQNYLSGIVNGAILYDAPGFANQNHNGALGNARLAFSLPIPSTASNSVWSNVIQVTPPTNGGSAMRVTLTGTVAGVGNLFKEQRRYLWKATGAVTATTIGADIDADASAGALNTSFDVATHSGRVDFKTKLNAGGSNVFGTFRCELDGPVERVVYGA